MAAQPFVRLQEVGERLRISLVTRRGDAPNGSATERLDAAAFAPRLFHLRNAGVQQVKMVLDQVVRTSAPLLARKERAALVRQGRALVRQGPAVVRQGDGRLFG
jgi:hypothetical protein